MTFDEWKESHYGKNYQHGYDENGVCDGTCDSCLHNEYVNDYLGDDRYMLDEELSEEFNDASNEALEVDLDEAAEHMNARNKALDDFHNTILPEWDDERIKEWMLKELNAAEIYALKDYFFELYSIAESAWYKKI